MKNHISIINAITYSVLHLLINTVTFLTASELLEPNNPGPRWGHTFVYDPFHQQILLFGGAREQESYLDDTWIWDGNEWHKKNVAGPTARGFSGAAIHEERKTIILHGGRGNKRFTYSDTWEWNGSDWKQIESESAFAVDHHQMVYVASDNVILAYGGWNGKDVTGNTWIWSGRWIKSEEGGPNKRAAFAMAYHKQSDKVILFGGLWIDGQYADLWEWSDGKWHSRGMPYDNSSLDHHSMIYDEKLQRVIIFGGKNYRYRAQQKTLTVEGNKVIVLSTDGPSARHSIGLTYDSEHQYGYLYGGKEYKKDNQVALGDFWKWDGEKWEKIE